MQTIRPSYAKSRVYIFDAENSVTEINLGCMTMDPVMKLSFYLGMVPCSKLNFIKLSRSTALTGRNLFTDRVIAKVQYLRHTMPSLFYFFKWLPGKNCCGLTRQIFVISGFATNPTDVLPLIIHFSVVSNCINCDLHAKCLKQLLNSIFAWIKIYFKHQTHLQLCTGCLETQRV